MARKPKTFLKDTHSYLLGEWDYEKNSNIDLKIIDKKRIYVEQVLNAKFEFLKISLNKEKIKYIKEHKLWK